MTQRENSLRQRFTNLTLHKKILLPFFLILLLLGCVVTIGTHYLIRQVLIETADQRLNAIHETIFREVKKQELLLLTYANLVEFQHFVTESDQKNPQLAMMQDNLLTMLGDAKIAVAIYPAESVRLLGMSSLDELFRQADESNKPRFRFLTEPSVPPSLGVALPVGETALNPRRILFLQTPIDTAFLKQIVSPFKTEAAFLSIDRKTLVTTDDTIPPPPEISSEDIGKILVGEHHMITIDYEGTPRRRLFSAIPLGSTDMVLLTVDLPLTDLDLLLTSMATRSGLTILAALALGSLLYYRLIRGIVSPLHNLLKATDEIGRGNLDYRIVIDSKSTGELGQLAQSFNQMVEELGNLYRQKSEQEKDLILAREGLRFNEALEQKNQEIDRANRELKNNLRELSMLFQLNQVMSSTLELNVMFDRTLGLLRDILNSTDMVLLLYNQGSEELEVKKSIGIDTDRLTGISFRLTDGITGLAARSREALYVRDVSADDRYLSYKGRLRDKGSMVSAPIVIKNRLVGVLNLHKGSVSAFSDVDLKLIQAATNQLAVAIENAQLYEKTRTLSNTDELTNLANRRHFQEILRREFSHAARYRTSFSLIMIDIDHFKRYNDTYGHLNGDIALRRVASILLQSTRGIDLVARFGGEEFIILLPKTTKEGAFAAAEKLRQGVENELFPLADETSEVTRITISLGIAEYPADGKDLFELIELADKALYQAKERGRNRSVVWNHELGKPTLRDQKSTADQVA